MSFGLNSEPCHSCVGLPDIPCAFDWRYVGGPVHEEDDEDSFRARVAWGFINKTGTLVIANQFNWVAQFSEGVAIVDRSSEFLVIDTNDQVLANLNQKKLSPDIDDARFSEGLMPVFSEEKEVMGLYQ